MNDSRQVAPWRRNGFRDFLGVNGNSADVGDMPTATDSTGGLVSFGFIWSALRRSMLVWLAVAVIGLIVGFGLTVVRPPAHTAATTVLLDTGPNSQGALQTDLAIAQSTPVAAAVVSQLKIQQTPVSFLGTYSAAALGNSGQVMEITAGGPTNDAAVQRASAIAEQFLAYRAKYLQKQLQQAINSLNQQVSHAQQKLNSITLQLKKVSSEPTSPTQAAQMGALPKEQAAAENALNTAQQNANSTQVQDQATTAQMVHGSQVLSTATPVSRSVKKTVALYAAGGLVGGLVVGMAIVVVAAIISDKVRRRDDIAIAAGAPVMLSVGRLRRRRWLPELRGESSRRTRDMERVVEHLRKIVSTDRKSTATLAVVTVDDAPTVAQVLIELAIAGSRQDKQVVLADLSAGTPAAHQLGITSPGIDTVSPGGTPLVVVVPEPEDVAPIGPARKSSSKSAQVDERLAEATAHADLVLSIVTLNPALGGDYLKTWATDAVLVVTAGRSTATRLHAAGEMIRLAGTRLRSVVVLGADKADESLGTVTAVYQPASAAGH